MGHIDTESGLDWVRLIDATAVQVAPLVGDRILDIGVSRADVTVPSRPSTRGIAQWRGPSPAPIVG